MSANLPEKPNVPENFCDTARIFGKMSDSEAEFDVPRLSTQSENNSSSELEDDAQAHAKKRRKQGSKNRK